jgi:PKD repeat protein
MAGKLVSFADNTPKAKSWAWDFGDQTQSSSEKMPIHIYQKAGNYLVKLIVNENCEVSRTVIIKEKYIAIDSTYYPEFDVPLTATVGVPVRFFDNTRNAKSWQWSFGESAVTSSEKSPVYAFQSPGKKTITLVVNGRRDFASVKRITVLPKQIEKLKIEPKAPVIVKAPPKPAAPKPAAPKVEAPKAEAPKKEEKPVESAPIVNRANTKAPDIEKEVLIKLLEDIAKGRVKINQLDPYTCGNLDIKIGINEEKSTLRKFFAERKKISISNVDMVKSENNCITFLKIRYKNTLL